jgi:hypothetical protein
LIEEIVKGSPTFLARAVVEIPQVKKCVIVLLLENINRNVRNCVPKPKKSLPFCELCESSRKILRILNG